MKKIARQGAIEDWGKGLIRINFNCIKPRILDKALAKIRKKAFKRGYTVKSNENELFIQAKEEEYKEFYSQLEKILCCSK